MEARKNGCSVERNKSNNMTLATAARKFDSSKKYFEVQIFFLVGWDLRHQVLRPLLAYCTAPDEK
jgi:hypothetical protein